MLLIAVDEAGYGPRLGPLIVAATVWRIPVEPTDGSPCGRKQVDHLFAPLRRRHKLGELAIQIDDSKAIYSPQTGLDALHAVVSASLHWCGRDETCLQQILRHLCPDDLSVIDNTPWSPQNPEPPLSDPPFLSRDQTAHLLTAWRRRGIELLDVRTRVITARAFNECCSGEVNKADLLSETSLELVDSVLKKHGQQESSITLFCDRHGGRRYYGGLLQHRFPDSLMQVVHERQDESLYRLRETDRQIDVHFTVKGDSFTPVALSSIHAKYLRERFMSSFNAYFAARHIEPTPLKPTAGYPGDADRFIRDIAPIIQREEIAIESLIRSR